MNEYQERRAQYLRDAHDWAEDGELPDASADYEPIIVRLAAKTNLAHAHEIRKAYLRGYKEGRESGYKDLAAAMQIEPWQARFVVDQMALAYVKLKQQT